MTTPEIAAIIAIVVIVALWLAKKVGVTINKNGVALSADKNSEKDRVSAKKISQSDVDIENRENQNIDVEDVSNGSNVKIK